MFGLLNFQQHFTIRSITVHSIFPIYPWKINILIKSIVFN